MNETEDNNFKWVRPDWERQMQHWISYEDLIV